MNHRFLIYGLSDPRTGEIRYIGKSVNGVSRAKSHGTPAALRKDGTYKANWIRSLQSIGLNYGIEILGTFEDGTGLADSERWAIAYARSAGCPLTNLTDGGDGAPNPSPEVRKRRSDAMKSRVFTAEHRERISTSKRGVRQSEAHRAALSAVRRGRNGGPPVGLRLNLIGDTNKRLASGEYFSTEAGRAHQFRASIASVASKKAAAMTLEERRTARRASSAKFYRLHKQEIISKSKEKRACA